MPAGVSGTFISLQHDHIQSTATTLLERAITLVRSRGYRLLRVDECLDDVGGAYRY